MKTFFRPARVLPERHIHLLPCHTILELDKHVTMFLVCRRTDVFSYDIVKRYRATYVWMHLSDELMRVSDVSKKRRRYIVLAVGSMIPHSDECALALQIAGSSERGPIAVRFSYEPFMSR